jgi:surfactin synthase thioesterase subunit
MVGLNIGLPPLGFMVMSRSLVSWGAPAAGGRAIVCFPWAGAGAAPFRSWGAVLGDVATVHAVRLPGRENRRTDPPAATVAEVVGEVAAELTGLGVPRVALFGQCSGAILAFELARALAGSRADVEVTHLLVASQLAPPDFAGTDLGAQDLLQYVPAGFREEPDFVDLLLPAIAADIALVSGYEYRPAALTMPVTVLYGADDPLVSRGRVDAWRHETTGPATFREIPGGDHLLSGAAWRTLAESVRAALS